MKIYFHKLAEILYPDENSKIFRITSKYFRFFGNMRLCRSSRTKITSFLACCSYWFYDFIVYSKVLNSWIHKICRISSMFEKLLKRSYHCVKKCPYSKFFWSVFPLCGLSIFSPNAGKYTDALYLTRILFIGGVMIINLLNNETLNKLNFDSVSIKTEKFWKIQ